MGLWRGRFLDVFVVGIVSAIAGVVVCVAEEGGVVCVCCV